MSYSIVQGDLSPNLSITIGIGDLVEPLSAAQAIKMHWIKPDGTEALVTLTAIDLPNGKLQYIWQAGDTTLTGVHQGRVIVTLSTGKPQSFPSDGTWIYWYIAVYTPLKYP